MCSWPLEIAFRNAVWLVGSRGRVPDKQELHVSLSNILTTLGSLNLLEPCNSCAAMSQTSA